MDASIAVFMPARNEHETIGENLRFLKEMLRRGKINHVALVIDGSVDGTREIIFRELGLNSEEIKKLTGKNRGTILHNGFVIINHAQPEGKGRSFMEAMFTLKGRTNHFKDPKSAVVNIDADALYLKEEHITRLVEEMRRKEVPMLLGDHQERNRNDPARYAGNGPGSTGYRAIAGRALEPLFKMDEKWAHTLPPQFGMDYALNLLIYPKSIDVPLLVPRSGIELGHLPSGRHLSDSEQVMQRHEARNRFEGDLRLVHENAAFRERNAQRQGKIRHKKVR
ncbi:MAG: glycosyltransferase [archaeon]|nr:glycosyltransferase [archaeon]